VADRSKPAGDSKLLGFSVLSVSSILSALLTFFRFSETTAIFGANWQTDALAVAMVFPFLVKEVVAHSFGSAFIPIYSRVMEKRGHDGAVSFVNKTLSWLVLVSSALIAVLWFSSGILVKIISPSGSEELLMLAADLFKILLPMVILGTTSGILANFIKYEKRFTALSLSGIIGLFVSLAILVVVRDSMGIGILPVSMLIGGVVEFLFLLVQCFRSGFKVQPSLSSDPFMGQLSRMAIPVVGGTMIGFLGPIADKMMASFLPESSVTAIDYANRIKNIVLAVVFNPLLTFADLSFSAEAAKGKVEELLSVFRRNMNTTSLVMFPSAALLTVLAVPIVSVFFQRGNFTADDSLYIGYALAFYAPWLAQFGGGSLISRVFYAQKDSGTPVVIGIFGVVANVLLNLILIGPLGIGGLALATTITSTAKTGYLLWALSRKMGGLNLRLIVKEQIIIFLANAALVCFCVALKSIWSFSVDAPLLTRSAQLAAYTGGGVLVMVTVLFALRSATMTDAASRLLMRIRNRSSLSE
jgi:putative peptidoglycan lipid II flippase